MAPSSYTPGPHRHHVYSLLFIAAVIQFQVSQGAKYDLNEFKNLIEKKVYILSEGAQLVTGYLVKYNEIKEEGIGQVEEMDLDIPEEFCEATEDQLLKAKEGAIEKIVKLHDMIATQLNRKQETYEGIKTRILEEDVEELFYDCDGQTKCIQIELKEIENYEESIVNLKLYNKKVQPFYTKLINSTVEAFGIHVSRIQNIPQQVCWMQQMNYNLKQTRKLQREFRKIAKSVTSDTEDTDLNIKTKQNIGEKYDLTSLKKLLKDQKDVLREWVTKLKALHTELRKIRAKGIKQLEELDLSIPHDHCDAEEILDSYLEKIQSLVVEQTTSMTDRLQDLQKTLNVATANIKSESDLEEEFHACQDDAKCIQAIVRQLQRISDTSEASRDKIMEEIRRTSEQHTLLMDKLVDDLKIIAAKGKLSPGYLCDTTSTRKKEKREDKDSESEDWATDVWHLRDEF